MEATWPTLVGKMHKCRAGLVMFSRPPLVMGSNENSYLSYRFTGGWEERGSCFPGAGRAETFS